MKSVKHKGLALVAVSSSVVGLGVGLAGNASALAWSSTTPGPTAALKATGTVSGSGATAALTVTTDSSASTGKTNTTDFGDGTTSTKPTDSHTYKAGALKQTLTETSVDAAGDLTSTTQTGVDATDATNIVWTQSVPITLAAKGAVVTAQGTSAFDLTKILPATADLSALTGTCDHGTGAIALTVDPKAKTALCDWTGANTAGQHIVTLTYTDKTTGLKSTAQEAITVPTQPVATFKTAVLSPGVVQADLTGSVIDPTTGGAGVLDWGDGSTTTVQLPLKNDAVQNHQYSTPGTKTITFSITDKYGEHAASTAQVDVTKATVDYGQLTRFAGATRYGTGVAVSQQAFPFTHSASAVVLARGDVYADALDGIPLAKAKNASLLLTPGGDSATTLDPNVAAEIRRVLPADKKHTVYILGGTDAIPQSIENYISNTMGYNVDRFGGPTRYETALAVAQDPRALDDPKHVVVARGDDFADALASGPFASDKFTDPATGAPAAIVLSTGNGVTQPVSMSPQTAQYVDGKMAAPHPAGQPNVAVIGGGAVKAVAAVAPRSGDYTQIAGVDRFDTAAKVASVGWGDKPTELGIASGMNFPDSLTGGALMALQGNPLLLSDPAATPNVSVATGAVLNADKSSVKNTYLFGGTQVFTEDVAQSVIKLEGLSAAHYHVMELPF